VTTAPITLEFLGAFVASTPQISPAQIAAFSLGLVAALWIKPSGESPMILTILALMWPWNGNGDRFLLFIDQTV